MLLTFMHFYVLELLILVDMTQYKGATIPLSFLGTNNHISGLSKELQLNITLSSLGGSKVAFNQSFKRLDFLPLFSAKVSFSIHFKL